MALYEGTWEKYHKGTDFAAAEDKSADLLGQVLTLGDELFGMGLTLNTKATDKSAVNIEDAYARVQFKRLVGYDRGCFLEEVFDSGWCDS